MTTADIIWLMLPAIPGSVIVLGALLIWMTHYQELAALRYEVAHLREIKYKRGEDLLRDVRRSEFRQSTQILEGGEMSSEWKTIDELMAGRKFGDVRITRADWSADMWFMPLFRDIKDTYYGIVQSHRGTAYEDAASSSCPDRHRWKLYEEPKQPLYQWARLHQCNAWMTVALLMTEEQVANDSSGAQYRKIGGPFHLDSNGE